MPVFRNLWNAQQQLARRHLQEQTSVTLGTTDADPTVKPPYQDPHQRRHSDPSAYAAIQANQAWRSRRLNTTDLGTTNADPTIRPNYQDPHQRRHADPAISVVIAQTSWWRKTQNSNDLGLADYDPTVKAPNQDPYQRRAGLSAIPAVVINYQQRRMWMASSPSGGTPVTGTLATTNANDTLAASGNVTIQGSLATTNNNDTLSAAGATNTTPATTQVGSGPKDEVHPETRRFWESERQRLAAIADDDEILLLL